MRTKFIVFYIVVSCLILGTCLYLVWTGIARENDIRIAGNILKATFVLLCVAAAIDFYEKSSDNGKID